LGWGGGCFWWGWLYNLNLNIYNKTSCFCFMGNKTEELKRKGKNLIKDGCALVDTSNRTKDIGKKSVLGLASRKINFTVLMTSSEKKRVFGKLIKKYGENRTYAIMHAVKLYYALKGNINLLPVIYICEEGLNKGLLKHYLMLFLKGDYDENKINILSSLKPMFGKKNIADRLASKVRKNNQKPTIELEEKHFKKLGLL